MEITDVILLFEDTVTTAKSVDLNWTSYRRILVKCMSFPKTGFISSKAATKLVNACLNDGRTSHMRLTRDTIPDLDH